MRARRAEPFTTLTFRQQRPDRQPRSGAAGRLAPVLDEPSALAGDRGEPGLGVDGDGEADRLEQRQVRRRVGVGDALVEVEPLGVAVVRQDLRSCLAGRRHGDHLAGVRAVGADRHLGGDDLVEQRPQPLDGEAQRAGDQDRAVPERAVLAHPAHPGGERLRDDQLGEQLAGVLLDLLDRGVLVAAVEVAQEVGAVGAVELEQARRFGHGAQDVPDPLGRVEAAGREPRVALDDVRGDQRVLEVEGHDLTLGVEHLLAHAGHAIGRRRPARAWSSPGRAG